MIKQILVSFFVLTSGLSGAQVLEGVVFYGEEKIEGVSVFVKDSYEKEYLSDAEGKFSIDISNMNKKEITLIFMKEGYLTEEYSVLDYESKINIFLQKNTVLESITIDASNAAVVDADKTTYRVKKQLLINNSKASDALQTIPMVFKTESNGMSVFHYKGEEVKVIVNGNPDITDISFADADDIEKIEVFPFGNVYYTGDSNKPVINVILKKELNNKFREELSVDAGYLLDQLGANSNFVFNSKDLFASLRLLLFKNKTFNKTHIEDFDKTEDWDVNNKSKLFYLNPTISYNFNEKSKITSTSYLYFKKSNLSQELKDTTPIKQMSDIGNSLISTSLTYQYNYTKDAVFSTRLYYSNNNLSNVGFQDYYDWNSRQKTNTVQGEVKFNQDNVKIFDKSFRYNLGYSFYTLNSIFSNQLEEVNYKTHQIRFGNTLKFTDALSLNTSLFYVNSDTEKKKENFILPKVIFLYQTDNKFNYNLSYSMGYNLAPSNNQNKTEIATEYFDKNIGNTDLYSSLTHKFNFGITKDYKKYNFNADISYTTNINSVIDVLSIQNNNYISHYENGGFLNKYEISVGATTSLFDDKLLVNTSLSNYLYDLKHKNDSKIIRTQKDFTYSLDVYLKWIIDKSFSASFSTSLYANRYQVYSYDRFITPHLHLSLDKNISKNFDISLLLYNSFRKEEMYRFYDNKQRKLTHTSGFLNKDSYAYITMRYRFGSSKVKAPEASSLQTDF